MVNLHILVPRSCKFCPNIFDQPLTAPPPPCYNTHMQNLRELLNKRYATPLAFAGEACALACALVCTAFAFATGFAGLYGRHISCYAVIGGSAYGGAAGVLALCAPAALLVLTALRYVRFLAGKSAKDSFYFCCAVYFSYLAGIMLMSAAAAGEALSIDGATIAGIALGSALLAASLILYLVAERGTYDGAAPRRLLSALCTVLTLMLFALLSLGIAPTGAGELVSGFALLMQRLAALRDRGEFVAETDAAVRACSVAAFLFLVAFAVCAVLLLERLAGNVARGRKPTLLRALLSAACGILCAALELTACMRYAAYASVTPVYTVPAAAMLLCVLLAATAAAEFLLAWRAKNRRAPLTLPADVL